MEQIQPLFQPGPASVSYENVRDLPNALQTRTLIERIWPSYHPHADSHFPEDLKQHFHQRTWEMYLWYVLATHGFSPTRAAKKGPDYRLTFNNQRIWIEAVAPERGNGNDAVPQTVFLNDMIARGMAPIAQEVPEEAILLRFANALDSKRCQYDKYLDGNLVHERDPFVVAINGCMATDYRGEPQIPFCIKAALGLGHLTLLIDPSGKSPTTSHYQTRTEIIKKNQQPVSTDLFLRDEYRRVSAILYSPSDICNISSEVGSEMYYLHNPRALNPLPGGIFNFCREYWVTQDGSELQWKD